MTPGPYKILSSTCGPGVIVTGIRTVSESLIGYCGSDTIRVRTCGAFKLSLRYRSIGSMTFSVQADIILSSKDRLHLGDKELNMVSF